MKRTVLLAAFAALSLAAVPAAQDPSAVGGGSSINNVVVTPIVSYPLKDGQYVKSRLTDPNGKPTQSVLNASGKATAFAQVYYQGKLTKNPGDPNCFLVDSIDRVVVPSNSAGGVSIVCDDVDTIDVQKQGATVDVHGDNSVTNGGSTVNVTAGGVTVNAEDNPTDVNINAGVSPGATINAGGSSGGTVTQQGGFNGTFNGGTPGNGYGPWIIRGS